MTMDHHLVRHLSTLDALLTPDAAEWTENFPESVRILIRFKA